MSKHMAMASMVCEKLLQAGLLGTQTRYGGVFRYLAMILILSSPLPKLYSSFSSNWAVTGNCEYI